MRKLYLFLALSTVPLGIALGLAVILTWEMQGLGDLAKAVAEAATEHGRVP